jgi:hypothetical protein
MMIKTLLIFTAGIALSACAHDPSNRAIKTQCRLEMEAARTAVQLRKQGKTKRAILQSLPPLHADSTRLLHQMYQFVEDTYAFPDLGDGVYGIYRFEYCVRQLKHRGVPQQTQDVSPQLRACQAKYGSQVSRQAFSCVRAVFPPPVNAQASTSPD